MSTARPKRIRNAETSRDVIAVGHIIDLAERPKSCMRAGIKAKNPLVMYSSKICDDEMAATSVASLQVKVEQLGRQRSPSSVGSGSSTIVSCGGELSMTTMVQIVVVLLGWLFSPGKDDRDSVVEARASWRVGFLSRIVSWP